MSLSRSAVGLRSIYLKVKPAPVSLSERRAVLQVLKQHGDIEVFLKLRDPSSFVSVTKTAELAQELIASSPIQFEFDRQPPTNLPPPDTNKTPSDVTTRKTFTVHAFSGETHPHFRNIESSPLYGPWPDERSPFEEFSYMQDGLVGTALKHAIPRDMAATALRDWRTGTGPENTGGDAKDYAAQRERIRKLRSRPMQSIVEMYEAGVAQRALRETATQQATGQNTEQNSAASGAHDSHLVLETAGKP